MGRSEDEEAPTRDPLANRTASVDSLAALRGFHVEWDDGSVGIASDVAIFVRTAGLGSGRRRLDLIALDDLVIIVPDERRILARTRVPPAAALGEGVRRRIARTLGRLQKRGGTSAAFCRGERPGETATIS